jgi:hypothetical protein
MKDAFVFIDGKTTLPTVGETYRIQLAAWSYMTRWVSQGMAQKKTPPRGRGQDVPTFGNDLSGVAPS